MSTAIRTFGEEKSIGLVASLEHDNNVKTLLESLGFKWKSGPLLLDTPIDLYSNPNGIVEVIKRYLPNGPRVATYFKVIGETGLADTTIESLRVLSLREGYQEIGALTDRFVGL